MQPDKELQIWTYDAGHARHFFGVPADRQVRVVKEQPETDEEKADYRPGTKLFAVLGHEPQPALLSQSEVDTLLDTAPMGESDLEKLRQQNGPATSC